MKPMLVLLVVSVILSAGCKRSPAPDRPSTPSGHATCAVDTIHSYRSVAADPEGDSVAVRFDWGDGGTSAWSSLVASGDTVTASHSWSSPGTYAVMAQARDKSGVVSQWSASFSVAVLYMWTRTYGGTDRDEGCSVQPTTDGGYVVGGWTYSYGAGVDDFWLIKTDANGDATWTRTYGTAEEEAGFSVQQTQDGGYIFAGAYMPEDTIPLWSVMLVKTDAGGAATWVRTYGRGYAAESRSIEQTRDGGYVVAGTIWADAGASPDIWLLKLDVNGDTTWARVLGGVRADEGRSVRQTQDGGYIIAGTTRLESTGDYEVLLVKTDAIGDPAWNRTLGRTTNAEAPVSVWETTDGAYVVTGAVAEVGQDANVMLTKVDSSGSTLWAKVYGRGPAEGHSVRQTADGGYIVTGYCTPGTPNTESEVWLLKTDVNGDTVWARTYGGEHDDYGESVRQTEDGGYIIAGSTDSYGAGGGDAWLIKTGPNGELDSGEVH